MLIDYHCHILPGLDDGAQTLEDSVFLAGKLVGWGYQRAICTSHSSLLYRNNPSTVKAACALLQKELELHEIPLDIIPSLEYRLIPETWFEVRKQNWIMPWEGNHILVELPIREPDKTGSIEPVTEIRQLVAEGYQPVLAHPERYLYLSTEEYFALKAAGAQFQRNLGSVEGFYGKAVSERAAELNTGDMYEWIGTDLHSRKYAGFLDHFVFGRT